MKRLLFALLFVAPLAHAQAACNKLAWDYNAADVTTWSVTGFVVKRKIESAIDQCAVNSPIQFTDLVVAAPTARAYDDCAVAMNVTYCYKGVALNAAAASPDSNVVGRTVPLSAPPALLMRPVVGGP